MYFTKKQMQFQCSMFSFRNTQEAVRRETNEASPIEFIGYWILPHEQNGCAQSYSQGINQQKCVGKFWYLTHFSRGVHLRNTSRIFLATLA